MSKHLLKYRFLTICIMAMLQCMQLRAQDTLATVTANYDETLVAAVEEIEPAPVATIAESQPISMSTDAYSVSSVVVKPYEPHHGADFRMFKSVTNPNTKPYTFWQDQTWVGIPLFFAGMIAKNEKTAFRQDYNNPNTKIRLIKYNFHNEIDNYTQYVPLALTIGLHLGGVEGRSDWPRFWASAAMSSAIMAGMVNGIKYTASEMRPDGSTRNSWPSGHTATAFMAATILHKEYGATRSPWISLGAYTLATATGVMRVLNNRHWVSDVLSGAGIGILSVELGYGICDLLFKGKGLLRNDLAYYPDLRENPSFFAISMGVGLGNKNLNLPAFDFDIPEEFLGGESAKSAPLQLKFRSATVVGAEGAYFFNPYIGIGGRLRVKATPINGWSQFALSEENDIQEFFKDPILDNMVRTIKLTIESDHITEFAADAGVYFSLPLSSRFAIGSKLLVGRSVMDDIEVKANYKGERLNFDFISDDSEEFPFKPSGEIIDYTWDYINVSASNSTKFGTGISFTYAYKNSFSWRVFCDYDYSRKTFTATYHPLGLFQGLSPDMVDIAGIRGWDMTKPVTSSATKNLHQWVLGAALCISF